LMAQAVAGLANALSDGDQAIFKLEGLLDIMRGGSEGDAAIRTRLSQLQHGRSVARAVAIDAKQESFEYVSRSFGGYDTGLYALMFILSAACGIPVTLLFGRAPAGLNASGDSDVRFFYDTIRSEQELRLLKPLRRLLTVLMSSAEGPTSGNVPDTWSVSFRPLTQSTPLEHADIRLKTAQADQIELDMGVVTADEIAKSHYGGDEYDQNLTLDASLDRDTVDVMPELGPASSPTGQTDNVQQTALNGAQVSSLVTVVQETAAGRLPRDAALQIIVQAFQVSEQVADRILGSAGRGFVPATPTPQAIPGA